MTAEAQAVAHSHHNGEAEYLAFTRRISDRLHLNLQDSTGLFTTDAGDLWPVYLGTWLDADRRQYHNCRACQHFVKHYGSLATINKLGHVVPALWDESDAPPEYAPAARAMARAVRRANVTGVFYSGDNVWGKPEAGGWHHLWAGLPIAHVWTSRTEEPHQASARKAQGRANVRAALARFSFDVLETAVRLLRADQAYRGEKVLGVAEWLHELEHSRRTLRGQLRENWLWRQVAAAPEGFLHPQASMIGTLLEDLAYHPPEVALPKFRAKMNPSLYQRPQAKPSAATIDQAERLFARMDAGSALLRRFATIEDIRPLWKPRAIAPTPTPGRALFDHLRHAQAETIRTNAAPRRITWAKFARDVLPEADRIRLKVPAAGAFTSIVTAVGKDSAPVLQWDRPEDRNPASWYFWNKPVATAGQFGLKAGYPCDVVAITLQPNMWTSQATHIPRGVLLVLKGARDTKDPGLCLFPEWLRDEFHGVRSVIEAHSKASQLLSPSGQLAAGYMLQDGPTAWDIHVSVTSGRVEFGYLIDRWE